MSRNELETRIYLRKDGRYSASVTKDGKRKCFYGNTEEEVRQKIQNYHLEERQSVKKPDLGSVKNSIQLAQMLNDWLESDMRISLKPKSFETKKYTVSHFIIPALGNRRVDEIRRTDIQKLIAELSQKYAWWTVKKVYDALNQCYKAAMLDQIVDYNPVVGVKLPKRTTDNCKAIRFFTQEELQRILDVAVETYPNGTPVTRLGYAIHVLAYTGMRVGEAIALTWKDVDFGNKTISINKNSVTYKNPDPDEDKRYLTVVQDSPKTKSGIRMIPMSSKAEFALKKLYEINGGFDTVFATSSGRPANHRDLARAFSGIQKRADISEPGTLHSLRHTFATRLIECGVDVKIVSELLGHSNVVITYNTYIHVLQKQKVRAIAELDAI